MPVQSVLKKSIIAFTWLALCISSVCGENWPQWRGPTLDGVSREANLPVRWTRDENVAWKLPLPSKSGATPIIWGDKIFLNVADKQDLWLWCVERGHGRVLWKKHIAAGNFEINKHNMSSPSPVTDGTNVYAMTGTGVLKAFDFSGKELWARDIQKDYGRFGLNWGYGSSPLLFENALYIQVLHGMKT
jgi:outer membrane protein assembly factor BamB